MNVFKKYYRKFLVWWGIQKIKPEKEIIEMIKKNTKVVEQQECDHKILSAIFPTDIWYRCTKCNQVWIITQAMTLNANKLKELTEKLQKIGKIIPKTKKVMSLKKWGQKKCQKKNYKKKKK